MPSTPNKIRSLKKELGISVIRGIPSKSIGSNGDMLLSIVAGNYVLFCKIQNSWKAVELSEISKLRDRIIDPLKLSWIDNSIKNHDSGWFTMNDSNDTNLIDTTSDKSRYRIVHNLNSGLVSTAVYCRFEALSDGEIKEYIIDLSSHISHPGPNQSRTGYWVNIINSNTIELFIHPDGLSIIYGEVLKDSNSNTSMLLSSYDTSEVGSIELRVIVSSVLKDKGRGKVNKNTSSHSSISGRGSERIITGNIVSGDKGAATDGTKNGSFKIDSDGTGVLLKNDAGVLKVRNIDDDNDADISLKDLTVGTFTGNQTAIFNAGLSAKNGATGAGYIEFFEDSDNGTNKCTLIGQSSILDYTVTLPPGAGTLRTVETTPLVINYPFWFDDTTTGRTYFRDADDPNDIMSWDGFDTEDSTSVDATATIVTANAVSGVVVPYACTYVGAYFLGYQSAATAGEAIFQTWTGVPGDGTGSASTTVTLRTTNAISANRASESFATSDVSISLAAGSMIYPAFQYVSGTSPKWMGNIALKFENITV